MKVGKPVVKSEVAGIGGSALAWVVKNHSKMGIDFDIYLCRTVGEADERNTVGLGHDLCTVRI